MANPWARDRATNFYLGYGLFAVIAVLIGFSTTYALPMARQTFSAPWFVHLHGASALGWVLLLITQTQLVRAQRTPLHRRIGLIGLPLAILVWISGVATAAWAAERDYPTTGSAASSNLAGTTIGLGLFVALVVAAVIFRKQPDWHKRLLILATIQVLWPAFFRWRHLLPMIPNPDVWLAIVLAYAPIVVAALRDYRICGRIHPVWLYVAPALVFEQVVEFIFFDRGPVRALGQWLYSLLT